MPTLELLRRTRFRMPNDNKLRRLCYLCAEPFVQCDGRFFARPTFLRLTESLARHFPQVELLFPGFDADWMPKNQAGLLEVGFPYVQVRTLPMRGGRLWRSLKQVILFWHTLPNSDLVCLDIPNESSFLALLVCRLRRKPFFVRVVGDWGRAVLLSGPPTLGRRIKAALGEWMGNFMVRQSCLVFTQGKSLYDKYAKQNQAAVKSDMVHSTLMRDVYQRKDSEPFHAPIRLLSVSGLGVLKGLDILVEAVHLLFSRGLQVVWWCVGEGSCRPSLEKLAGTLGVADRVRFWGEVPFGPDLFELYKRADVFVQPSLTEGVPNALLEAMAHSLPVVASAVGGIPGVITNGVHGLLVTPGHADQIRDAVCRLAGDPDFVTRMRRAAFSRAQEYSFDVVSDRCKRLIESTFGKIAEG